MIHSEFRIYAMRISIYGIQSSCNFFQSIPTYKYSNSPRHEPYDASEVL